MKIRSSSDLYFHQALAIMQNMPPFNLLTKKELLVYGQLLYVNAINEAAAAENNTPKVKLLNSESRDFVVAKLEITAQVFRNALTKLRQHGLIVNNELVDRYTLKYLQPLTFEFYDEYTED